MYSELRRERERCFTLRAVSAYLNTVIKIFWLIPSFSRCSARNTDRWRSFHCEPLVCKSSITEDSVDTIHVRNSEHHSGLELTYMRRVSVADHGFCFIGSPVRFDKEVRG